MKQALIALLLVPGMAHAVICKTVDADGVVSYTNVPATECQTPVKIWPFSIFESVPEPSSADVEGAGEQTSEPEFEGYQSIKIMQPEADGVVRSNEGKVSVVIGLEPVLQQGHRVVLHIDGNAVPGTFDGQSISLSGIERGTHGVRATVSDGSGKMLTQSPTVSFTLRQTGLFDGNATVPKPPTAKPVP